MTREFKTYLDLLGLPVEFPTFSSVGLVLHNAFIDRVSILKVSKDEYELIARYLICHGVWNWDKKTFMGMEFIIKDK